MKVVLGLASVVLFCSTAVAGGERGEVCHRHGNGTVAPLSISARAIDAHLAHGDHLPYAVYADADGDGYGTAEPVFVDVCTTPEDTFTADELSGTDCNDADATQNGEDDDGDGFSTCDGDCDDSDAALNPADADADGYSTCEQDCDDSDASLTPADGDGDLYSTCDGDCDDSDVSLNPADADADGYSTCDADCDDFDPNLDPGDFDGDGFSTCEDDCDDSEPTTNPGAEEILGDGIDNDCDDSTTDEPAEPACAQVLEHCNPYSRVLATVCSDEGRVSLPYYVTGAASYVRLTGSAQQVTLYNGYGQIQTITSDVNLCGLGGSTGQRWNDFLRALTVN